MNLDSFKEFTNFNPGTLLPELDTLLGKMELLLRILVMAGPVVLLVFGLIYLLAAPKEANHHLGYRCYFGMGSVEAWRYAQKLAGLVWSGLGLVLTVVMLILIGKFRGMDAEAMVWAAIKYILWELGLTVLACLCINITVTCFFDRNGNRRIRRKKEKN